MRQKWENFLLQRLKRNAEKEKSPENTGESSLFESDAELMEENQRLQSEVKRARRAEVEALKLRDITLTELKQCEDDLAEENRKAL